MRACVRVCVLACVRACACARGMQYHAYMLFLRFCVYIFVDE